MKAYEQNFMFSTLLRIASRGSLTRKRAEKTCKLGSIFLIACVLMASVITPAFAGEPKVVAYFDEEMTQRATCGGDLAPTLIQVRVVAEGFDQLITAIEYKLEVPPGWTFIGELVEFPAYIGSSPVGDGIQIGFGGAYDASDQLLLTLTTFLMDSECSDCSVPNEPVTVGPHLVSGLIRATDDATPTPNWITDISGGTSYACSFGWVEGQIHTHIEDFSTHVYHDAINTTASWDTTTRESQLPSFSPSLAGSYNTPGMLYEVELAGDYAFGADAVGGLRTIDISDPTNPTEVDGWATPGDAYGVAVAGDYAYVADGDSGLQVIDISSPTNLTVAGSYVNLGRAFDVAISGDYAYVADLDSGLYVIDISDPSSPTLAGEELSLYSCRDIAIAGNLAYLPNASIGYLYIVDISDPADPTNLTGVDTPGHSFGVYVHGDYVFVGDGEDGLTVIDINPVSPTYRTVVGTYDTPGNYTNRLTISGDYAYVAGGDDGLQVIDITDPTTLVSAGSYDTPNHAYGVCVSGEYAYVGDWTSGLQVIKIAQPLSSPLLAKNEDSIFNLEGIAIAGDYAYAVEFTGGLHVFDIAQPASPALAGGDPLGGTGNYQYVTIEGDYAYVAASDDDAGLFVVDISDPITPTQVAHWPTGTHMYHVAITGDYAFTSQGSPGGFNVFDISDPTNPSFVIQDARPTPHASVISGDYAYVLDPDTVYVYDISDPENPTHAGLYATTPGTATYAAVAGDYAYLAVYGVSPSLQVLDISDPTNPTYAGGAASPPSTASRHVTIRGDYAYKADDHAGLFVFDITDPENPSLAGGYNHSGGNEPSYDFDNVTLAGDYVYITDQNRGLIVLQGFERSLDFDANVAQSLPIDTLGSEIITSVKLSTIQTDSIRWELSADGGSNWQEVTANDGWADLVVPGWDLVWRSSHFYTQHGENPSCDALQIQWLYADSDNDGVYDFEDDCPGITASPFDHDGDGCFDPSLSARNINYWAPEDLPVIYVINEDGAYGINDGSDLAAIRAGYNAWLAVPNTVFSVAYAGSTTQKDAQVLDQVNLVTFDDPDYQFQSQVLAAVVTTEFTEPTVFNGRLYRPGQIVDADMMFNKFHTFTTTGPPGTDIQSIATHEAGHIYGLTHSPWPEATMHFVLPDSTDGRSLEMDDYLAFFKAYPDSSAFADANKVTGQVWEGGTVDGLPGAIVFALSVEDTSTQRWLTCEYTLPNGQYRFAGLPDGDYYLGIYPLNGSSTIGGMEPRHTNSMVFSNSVTDFPFEYWNTLDDSTESSDLKTVISVSGGTNVTDIDFVSNVDNDPPYVTGVYPDSNTIDIPIDASIKIAFSEPMDNETLTDSTFSLINTDTQNRVAGDAYIFDQSFLSFKPSTSTQHLRYETTYKLTLTTEFEDLAGNALAEQFTMSFTTEVEPLLHITSLEPSQGVAGTVIDINGAGFDTLATGNAVHFEAAGGGTVTADVISASPYLLTVTVPEGIISGDVYVEALSQTSESLFFSLLSETEVARGYHIRSIDLGALPRTMTLLPDGSFAYVATQAGACAVGVDPALPSKYRYVSADVSGIPGGLNDLDVTPKGDRVYGVSSVDSLVYVIDSDSSQALFNTVIDNRPAGAEPIGIIIHPNGRKAYVPTNGDDIQVWSLPDGGVSQLQKTGIVDPTRPLVGKMAIDSKRERLLALSETGELLVFDLGPDTLLTEITLDTDIDPRDMAVDPEDQLAYVSDYAGRVMVVSLEELSVTAPIITTGSLRGLAITPAGQFLYAVNRERNHLDVIGLKSGSPSFWNVTANIPVGTNPVDAAISNDGLYAFSLVEEYNQLEVTGIGLGPIINSVSRMGGPAGSKLVMSGSGFISGPDTSRVIFNTTSGDTTMVKPDHANDSTLTVTVPVGAASGLIRVVESGAGVNEESNEVRFVALDSTSGPNLLRRATQSHVSEAPLASTVAASPTGEQVAMGTGASEIIFVGSDPWDASFHEIITTVALGIGAHWVSDLAFTPDGKRLYASVSGENSIYVVNSNRYDTDGYGDVIGTVDQGASSLRVPTEMAISPAGEYCLVVDSLGAYPNTQAFVVDVDPSSSTFNHVIDSVKTENTQVEGYTEIAFHPNGLRAIALDRSGEVYSVDMNPAHGPSDFAEDLYSSPVSTQPEYPNPVPVSLSFFPDGSYCLVLIEDRDLDNSAIITFNTTDPQPVQERADLLSLPPSALSGGEKIDVSPYGDRAILHINNLGLYQIELTEPRWHHLPYTIVNQLSLPEHLGRMDHDYTPDGSGVYVVSETGSDFIIYDFNSTLEISLVSGNSQTTVVEELLPRPLKVRVTEPGNGPGQPGVAVTFNVLTGGGELASPNAPLSSSVTIATDSDGYGLVHWKLGPNPEDSLQTVEAVAEGLSGSPIKFTAQAEADPYSSPLRLSSVIPPDGTHEVSVTTAVQAIFSRSLDTLSVDSTTFYLRTSENPTPVPTLIGFTDDYSKLSLSPLSPLDFDTTYVIEITGGLRGTAGPADDLLNPASVSFTCKPDPVVVTLASVYPVAATKNTILTLAGLGFDPVANNNNIYFNADVIVEPVSAAVDALKVAVPFEAVSGKIWVQVGAKASNELPIDILIQNQTPVDELLASIGTTSPMKGVKIHPNVLYAYAVSPEIDKVVPINIGSLSYDPTIPVGDFPNAVDIHPNGKYAYVANRRSGNLTILDVDPDSENYQTEITTLAVGTYPVDLDVSPDGDRVVVVNLGSSDLSIIDSNPLSETHHRVISTVPLDERPTSVAISNLANRIYVGTEDGWLALDASTHLVTSRGGTVDKAKGVVLTGDDTILILLTFDGELVFIGAEPGTDSFDQVTGRGGTEKKAKAVVLSGDDTLLYIILEESDNILVSLLEKAGTISVLDSDVEFPPFEVQATVIDTIRAGEDPADIAFDPAGSGVAIVTNAGDQSVTLFNTSGVPADPVITYPNGGEMLQIGDSVQVKWDTPILAGMEVDTVDVFWTEDGGTNWHPIAEKIANVDSVGWRTPMITSDSCLVRVTLYIGGEERGTDEGDSLFTLDDVVPVRLASASAVVEKNVAVLRWVTASERELDGFHVLRSQQESNDYRRITSDVIPSRGGTGHSSYEFKDASIQPNKTYYYMIEEVSEQGLGRTFGPYKVIYAATFSLSQNIPNPFNPTTAIRFTIPKNSYVKLEVFDVLGRKVKTLVDGPRRANNYKIIWDSKNDHGNAVASGVYFYRLKAGKFTKTRKMLLLK